MIAKCCICKSIVGKYLDKNINKSSFKSFMTCKNCNISLCTDCNNTEQCLSEYTVICNCIKPCNHDAENIKLVTEHIWRKLEIQ